MKIAGNRSGCLQLLIEKVRALIAQDEENHVE
jgi:hypothetical protein